MRIRERAFNRIIIIREKDFSWLWKTIEDETAYATSGLEDFYDRLLSYIKIIVEWSLGLNRAALKLSKK